MKGNRFINVFKWFIIIPAFYFGSFPFVFWINGLFHPGEVAEWGYVFGIAILDGFMLFGVTLSVLAGIGFLILYLFENDFLIKFLSYILLPIKDKEWEEIKKEKSLYKNKQQRGRLSIVKNKEEIK